MPSKKLVLVGTHATGKSTLICKLEQHYKSNSKSVYVVNEVARSCPHKLGTIQAQRYIWYKQWQKEMDAAKSGCDIILCDRSTMCNLVYLRDILNQTPSGWGEDSFKFFYSIAKLHMKSYTHIVRLPLNLEYLKADDKIRPKSVEYARRIDKLFDEYISQYVNCTEEELWNL